MTDSLTDLEFDNLVIAFIASQVSLPPEFDEVLRKNAWDMFTEAAMHDDNMTDDETPGRKIDLPPGFRPSGHESGCNPYCDCDFPPKPARESDHGATWRCTRCGGEVHFDLWD